MSLVTSKEMFQKAYEGKYAVGAFNVDNVDIMMAVVDAAVLERSPLIIAISEGARKYIHPAYIRKMMECAASEHPDIPIVLHLDHGKSAESVKEAVDQGFTSVMIDASAFDFDTNVKITKEVVEYAHAHGVVVESELGAIAGVEDDVHVDDKYGRFTHPADAERFVKLTGIDSLAIAIGTAHGAYKFKPGTKPQLRFDILQEVEQRMPGFPIVLHGSSSVPAASLAILNQYGGKMPEAIGIPEPMLRQAASMGVCKINVGTDIRVAFVGGMRKALVEKPDKFDCREFFVPAKQAVTDLVAFKMENVFGSAHRI